MVKDLIQSAQGQRDASNEPLRELEIEIKNLFQAHMNKEQ